MSVALLMIWSPGSVAWVGPGVSNWDFAICCISLLIVLMYLNGLEPSDASLILFCTSLQYIYTVIDLRSRSKI